MYVCATPRGLRWRGFGCGTDFGLGCGWVNLLLSPVRTALTYMLVLAVANPALTDLNMSFPGSPGSPGSVLSEERHYETSWKADV